MNNQAESNSLHQPKNLPIDYVLEIKNLQINLGDTSLVDNISLHIPRGKTAALVGESGSGKSLTAAAIGAILPNGLDYTGEILVDGHNITQTHNLEQQKIHHRKIGMIFQDPLSTFDPVFTLGSAFSEVIRTIHKISKSAAYEMAYNLLQQVTIDNPALFLRKYPCEVSGGQLQRASIALALAHQPVLLIADEPTTALDVHIQAEILDLLHEIQAQHNLSIFLITHDMGVVADIADTVHVMQAGKIIEAGEVNQILLTPQSPYTQKLITAAQYLPHQIPPDQSAQSPEPILQLHDLSVHYKYKTTKITALDQINLTINQGEILAIIGESGAGKSTLGKLIIGLTRPSEGRILYQGKPLITRGKHRREYGKSIGVVFQNPFSSLNPAHTIAHNIALPFLIHHKTLSFDNKSGRYRGDATVNELLEKVGLNPAMAKSYPAQLSGGQLQRVAIAHALALNPELLILDEPTSALDVSSQEEILSLLTTLHREKKFTMVLVTHNMGVVNQIADRVIIMRAGHIIETGTPQQIWENPQTDYTQTLLAAIPVANPLLQAERRVLRMESKLSKQVLMEIR